jgi:hypothetical protein
MKLRHAAALALVGWYLMVPPSTDERAPLFQWEVVASYDSASACREALHKSKDPAQVESDYPSLARLFAAQGFLAAQCIATDDPRLKGN